MRKKVLVPLTRCAEGVEPEPMRWQRRPSSLAYDVSQVALYLGSWRSWRCSRNLPVAGSRTESAKRLGLSSKVRASQRNAKSVNLRRLHVIRFTETRKGQWLLSWVAGFCSRDVVLDLLVIRPPRGEQRKWCLGTGTCAMGNWFANGEHCRRPGRRVADSRWADQRHPWNWLSRSVSKVQPAWCCLPRCGGLLTDAFGGIDGNWCVCVCVFGFR
jgi:hypothetical protein